MTRLRHTARARGFSLVEVMVTLFIIAIGALGVAGLQLAAMRSNHSAYLRSHATLAAYALSDRLRAHPAELAGIKIDTDSPDGHALFADWARELSRTPLEKPANRPLATLDCTGAACGAGHCAITIRWNDSRAEQPTLAAATAVQAGGAAGRNIEALELRICARVPS
ncbi:MAG: type IV pilus modification protein PilV [Gammaproteobacteria bacterium]|jgi:type IV pilus assembly protein PilV|nr:type IV pilus modification protein PilV [Gammaproteobacteria bacterium]